MDGRAARSGVRRRVQLGDVLVVEDDATAREVLCATLELEGFAVRGASDVDGAIMRMAERPAEVVVTDLQLGGPFDGVDLARGLRAISSTAEVRVIAVTGAVEPEWSTVQHFDAYLRKPVDVRLLVQLVARLAGHARIARRSRSDERSG